VKAKTLNLITQYDAGLNEYIVFRHNLTREEADHAIRDLSARLFSLFVVDQRRPHPAVDPDNCAACHRDVERS
jgi:hypothetical protein